jgi:glycosyltransferase involved in cell wall biosynthesis
MPVSAREAGSALVSVVVPIFDEAAVLPELRRRLVAVLDDARLHFEVIVVDDGSTDGSAELADQFHAEDPRWMCVHLSRNFGHQAAVTAGLHHAHGDVVCVMDADLQDPPEVLLRLLAEWEKGSDVVYAVRRERKEHWGKVALYDLFYRLFERLSSVPMPLDAGDFSLLSRPALDAMNRLPEKERFVRGLRAWVGFRQTGVVYERQARAGGRSKYGLVGLGRLAINGLVSFSDKPLIVVMLFGLAISAAAFVYAAYLVALKLVWGGVVTGYASMMAALLFLSGIQLLAMGVVGLYLSKIFQEVKARPSYVVRSLCGFAPGAAPSGARPAPR